MESNVELVRTNANHSGFLDLVELLNQDLRVRDGTEHAFYAAFNTLESIGNVVVAHSSGDPVGCGAFKKYSDSTVEIKRMFVHPHCRGRGIARRVLKELEAWARELGYTHTILETGVKQIEAIRLYQKAGYTLIPNYDQYQGVENSVCYQKDL